MKSTHIFSLSLLILLGSASGELHASPLGATGIASKWQAAWSATFKDCFEKSGKDLQQVTPSDQANYCGGGIEPKDYRYWLSIFMPLAGKESNFRPDAQGKNGGRVPAGLFQMDSQDMSTHKCEGTDSLNPQQNICCAIKIADDDAHNAKALRRSASSEVIGGGKSGILSAFWQPMRSGMGGDGKGNETVNNTSNNNDIQKESQDLCKNHPQDLGLKNASNSNGSAAGTVIDYSAPQGGASK